MSVLRDPAPIDDVAPPGVRRLDPILVDRIAAGEVVERPASAVKELVENAIDAGASSIDVAIEGGGRRLIRVIDDGHGMAPDDLALAVERHATSKLPHGDLARIVSLGFRGEALPSIGAVSRLSIVTRRRTGEGASLVVEAGAKSPLRPAPALPGTRIEVTDLFAATPARLKFLKSDRAETAAVSEIVRRLAVAQPGIRFTLRSDSQTPTVFPAEKEPGPAATLRRLAAVLGPDFAPNAVPLSLAREGFSLDGHVGLPTYHRGASTHIHFVVNNRPVRDRLLLGAVRGAYADTMAGDRHPVLALYLTCDPGLVDVNVHPAKTELRFRDPALVRALVVSAIHDALRRAGARSSTTGTGFALSALRLGEAPRFKAHTGAVATTPGAASFSRLIPSVAAPASLRGVFADAPQSLFVADHAPPGAQRHESADEASTAHPLGAAKAQLHATYIVAQTTDGLVIVDQHAAHERLVYERLKRERASGPVSRQGLLVPDVVEMAPADAERLVATSEELDALGLTLEAFGPGAVLVRAVPAALAGASTRKLVLDVLDALQTSGIEEGGRLEGGDVLERRLHAVLSRMSCHGSIRAGRRLAPPEMDALLREMEAEPRSGSCNHGRPTFVELKLSDIEKLFGRR